jgi:alpha-L-fucosidase
MAGKVEYAQLLNDASEIRMRESQDSGVLTLELPIQRPNVTVPVIELFLKE